MKITLTLLAILLASPLAAQTPREGPDGANFWRVPSTVVAGAKRGDIYWTRERTDVPRGARGWNVIYVTEGAAGNLEYVSGEIYVPIAAAAAGQQRPLVVWNHGTSGFQDSCAPSRDNLQIAGGGPRVPALDDLIARGYVVAMSDYQGLGVPGPAAYLNGPAQAKASFDVARAARQFAPANAGNRVAMYGFSQGGQTSIWAASLAATYAPELTLLGVAAVAPAARHLDLSFYDLGIPANGGYFVTRMAGLAVGHPQLKLADILTPAGLALLDVQTWGCFELFGQAARLTEPYARREAMQPGQPWRARLEDNDRFLPLPINLPILILMGDKDIDVPVEQIRELRGDLCAQRARVEYREFAGVDHMQMNTRSAEIIPGWLAARFGAQPAPATCAGL